MPERDKSRIIRFGNFEVDPAAGEVWKSGVKIRVQQQPFQILLTLLSRPGEVVTREQLRQQLWAEDTFVDFEHGLNAAIKRLRDVLGDSAENPQFIETLARRGYRLIAPLSGDGNSSQSPRSALAGVDIKILKLPAGLPFTKKWLLGTVAVVAVLTAGLLVRTFLRTSPAGPPSLRVIPFTSNPGEEFHPAFSPDGREIAFASDAAGIGSTHIYTKLIRSERPLRLTQGAGRACCPAWSPDGRYVAFGRCEGDNDGLFIVPALGGPERKLSSEGTCWDGGLSWSPNGKFLALPGQDRPDRPDSVYVFSVDTLERRKLTSPPSHFLGDHQPAFSPDGKLIAFVRVSSSWANDIYVVAVEQGGEGQRVTFDRAFITGIAWAADGKSLIYASNRSGGSKLWRVRLSGGQSEALSVGGELAMWPAISRTGDRLAYTQGIVHTNIWRKAIFAGHRSASAPSRVNPSTFGDGDPQFSPDGTKIVFDSSRSSKGPELWVCDAECTDPIQLTSLGVLTGSPRWSPDGSQIAFDSRPGDHSQIFVIQAQGGIPRQVTDGEFEHAVPAWSHDGRWLYFASNRSGDRQLWKVPVGGGSEVQITHHGGFDAHESPDGRWVYYTKDDGVGIYQVSPSGGDERQLLNVSLAGWGYWDVGKRGIYFVANSISPGPTVKHYNFANQRLNEITSLEHPPYSAVPGFAVSPDERWILYLQVEANTDIMLVENFH